ncbi:MAG: metal ABC transporter permease [Phycisphaerae bacterium]
MIEFVRAVADHTFLQHALLAGVLAGVACGVIGSYVVVRRITVIAGSIAHCVLGGMGAARYLQRVHGWTHAEPLYGAVVAALAAAAVIGLVSLRAKQREDMVIGAVWAIGMAVGVLFISRTPGYSDDLMSYLFGDILLVSRRELWMMGALDLVIVAVGLLFFNQFLAVCFDEEFARLRGLNVELYYLLLLGLTALTVVLLVSVVGIVLVIALLSLPVAIAGHFARTLAQLMVLSALCSMLVTTGGLALSYGPNLPAGATSIVLAGAAYLIILLGRRLLRPATGRV